MKKTFLVIILLFSTLCFSSPGDYKVKKNLLVLSNETIDFSVVSFGGKIKVDGRIRGSIIMVGGELAINGKVDEDLVCISTRVDSGSQTEVKGDLIAIGGNLDQNIKNHVSGEFFSFKFNLKKIENTLFPMLSDTKTISFLRAIKIVLWFVIALLVLALLPKKINLAEDIFEKNIVKIGAIGIFSVFSLLSLLLIFIIMSFVIIGIPFLLALIILYFVLFIFGRTVMLFFIGSKITALLKIKKITPALFIVVGIIFYSILRFLPLVGPFLLIVMNILEIGIGTAFFLRKKLTLSGYSVVQSQ